MNDSKTPDLGEVQLSTSIISIVTQQHPHQSVDNNERINERVNRIGSIDSTTSTATQQTSTAAAAATVGPKVVKSTSTASSSSSSKSMGRAKTKQTVNLRYTLFRSSAMNTYWPVHVLKSSVLGIALYGVGHHKPSSSSSTKNPSSQHQWRRHQADATADTADPRSDQQSNTAHGFMRCGYQELLIELRYVRWMYEWVGRRDDDVRYSWVMWMLDLGLSIFLLHALICYIYR